MLPDNLDGLEDTLGEVIAFTATELDLEVLTATGLWVDRSRPERPMSNLVTQGFLPI